MTDWSERLRKRLDDLGMTPADLARVTGLNRDAVYKYFQGKVPNPRGDTLARIASAIGMQEPELRYGVTETVSSQKIPLIAMNKLGTIEDTSQLKTVWDGVSVFVAGDLSEGSFAVSLVDDACAPDFPRGSIIVCDPSEAPSPGRYVVAIVDGLGAVVRRYRKRDAGAPGYWLIADNPDFPDIHVAGETETARILGRAVKHIRDI